MTKLSDTVDVPKLICTQNNEPEQAEPGEDELQSQEEEDPHRDNSPAS